MPPKMTILVALTGLIVSFSLAATPASMGVPSATATAPVPPAGAIDANQAAPPPASRPATTKAQVYQAWPFDPKEAARRQDDSAKALGVQKV